MLEPRRTRGPCIIHDNELNWVYSLWSGDACLYVGITNNLKRRLAQHRSGQPWWPEVDRIVSDKVIGRVPAMEFEAHDIRKYRPKYNIAHNPDHHRDPLGGIEHTERGLRVS
ncbi:MAG: GIY-YIG nuclease family protein [Nocardioidaceae bacterium]|nr:MAG: GIY-YIG nuclease family protein [Nocardioidaceae bacterium]